MTVPRESSEEEVSAAIERVASRASEWAALAPAAKRDLLAECLENLKRERDALARAACAARGYDFEAPGHAHLVGEAYILGCATVGAWIRGGITLLDALAQTGKPPQGTQTCLRPDGRVRVTVFPNGLKERLLGDTGRWEAVPLGEGGRFEVVVRCGRAGGEDGEGAAPPRQFSPLELGPSVTGVLGAGNTEICNDIIDPLCKLNSVVVYKSNPVMALGNGVKERILAPLIERGYLAFLYGGPEPGRRVVESDRVDRVLITGSHQTFDRIVWAGRDKSDPSVAPAVPKPFLAELGSVNPYVVIPGDSPWTPADLEAQAGALVAYKMVNSGHICAAPQVLVTCRNWVQRGAFLEAVRRQVAIAPAARCFYPGVRAVYERHAHAMGAAGDFDAVACAPAEEVDDGLGFGDSRTPLLFQTDALERQEGDDRPIGLGEEAFSPVLLEVALDTRADLKEFLPAAIEFCHAKCWGSLTCALVVDDATQARHQEAFEAALDSMRFGTIGVNFPPSAANTFPLVAWGAFPGNNIRDVRSGMGHVGNFCCFEDVEKTILRGRFRNLYAFRLAPEAGSRARALKRGRRLSDLFMHMTYWRIAKFASADFLGL